MSELDMVSRLNDAVVELENAGTNDEVKELVREIESLKLQLNIKE